MERAAAQELVAAIAAHALVAAIAAKAGISWVLLNLTFDRFAMEIHPSRIYFHVLRIPSSFSLLPQGI